MSNNEIIVRGLLGVDIIQYLKPMQLVECMKGSAWEIPFGNISNFLLPDQNR